MKVKLVSLEMTYLSDIRNSNAVRLSALEVITQNLKTLRRINLKFS